MHPVKVLPEGYVEIGTLDLSKNTRAFIVVQLAALVSFFAFARLFWSLAHALRPKGLPLEGTFQLWELLGVLLSIAIMVLAHEAVHGLFFWLFTGERPQFGFTLAYAYAAAPDWHLPRDQYLVVGLAPFVALTGVGIVLLPFVSSTMALMILAVMTFNASGAVGDIVIVGWCLFQARSTLVRDAGDAVTLYEPAADAAHK